MSAAPAFRDSAATAEAAQAQLLYERYAGQVQRFCRSRLRSREEAEDAVQHTFLNAYRSLRQGTVPRAEAAWVFAIAANVCRERRRAAWRRSRVEAVSEDGLVAERAAPEREPENLAGLADALSALTANQRRAILMREWQGLSYREIAGELGVTEAAVETLLFRARRALTRMRGRVWGWSNLGSTLGSALAWGKTMLSGSAAQVAAATLAVTAGVTAATPLMHHSHPQPATTLAAAKPAAASQVTAASPVSAIERPSAPAAAPSRVRTHAQPSRPAHSGTQRSRPHPTVTPRSGGTPSAPPRAAGPSTTAAAAPSGGASNSTPAPTPPSPPAPVQVQVPPVQVGPVQTPPVQVEVPVPPLPPPLPQLPQLPPVPLPQLPQLPPVTLPQLPSVQLPPPPPLP
jgi:RNA polymerase sigma-70 factor (ECF subfamily)